MILESLSHIAHWLPSTVFFSDLPFWGYFIITVILIRSVSGHSRVRDFLLLAVNLLMLMALPRFDTTELTIYCGLAVFTYVVGYILLGDFVKNHTGRVSLGAMGIIAVILALAFFKYRIVQEVVIRDFSGSDRGGVAKFVFLIGISYASFKAIHFIIESYKKNIQNLRFIEFLNYLMFFPSFVSGPISRYNDFYENSASAKGSRLRDDLLPGVKRIFHGLFKKFVITVILFPHTLIHPKTPPVSELALWQVLMGLYAYALYFYFDFSGYTDLAIGTARLLGFKLPENFNLPLLKKNIQKFWANWHMSLTGWLTDYVYWPLVRRLRNYEMLRKYPLLISNTAIVLTFFLCGAWHGEGVNFILWGMYHGVGIVIVNLYQKWKRQVRHPLALKYYSSFLSHCIGVALTFNYFAIGLMFLFDAQDIASVFGRLF